MQITLDDFDAALRSVARTAVRLEVQPAYLMPYEQGLLENWLAGKFQAPDEIPEIRTWYDQIREQVAAGKHIARVRVQKDPPTTYQQFEAWGDRWNEAAGEQINYLAESRAYDIGLYPEAEGRDWWLLDGHTLLVFTHEGDGTETRIEQITDPEQVAQATAWWELALSASVPSSARGQGT